MVASLLAGVRVVSAQPAAAPSARLHVQVRVERPADEKLLERLRGQTSDLPIELSPQPVSPSLSSFADTVRQTFVECRRSGADVVVWASVAPEPSASLGATMIAAIATCADEKLLLRRIEAQHPALEDRAAVDSGAVESVALVLRSALAILARGGTLGASSTRGVETWRDPPAPTNAATSELTKDDRWGSAESADRATPSRPEPEAPSPVPRVPAASSAERTDDGARASSESDRSLSAVAQLGFVQAWDGRDAQGQPALSALLALARRHVQLGARASFGFATSHDDPFASITLTRHALAASARQQVLTRPSWSLGLAVELGAVLYRRTTRAIADLTQAEQAARIVAATLGASGSLARRAGPLSIVLEVGLDVVPAIPRFVYRTQGAVAGTRDAVTLWPVAPRLGLSLAWESR